MKTLTTIFITVLLIIPMTAQEGRVEKLNKEKLEQLSDNIIMEQARLKEQLRQIESNMVSSTKLREVLTEANKAKYKSYVTNLSSRYDAGQEILFHVIKETNSFNLSFSQLVLQSQFGKLIDPTTYSEFNNSMNSTLTILGDRKPFPTVKDVNNLKQEIPVLDNPLITTGLSIVTYFLAKYHKKKDLEAKNFRSLTCVLSFTNKTKKDYDIIIAQLLYLSKRLTEYNEAAKKFFSIYLKEIGYSEGYTNYLNKIDEIETRKKSFFKQLSAENIEIGVISYESNNDDKITYQIEQVKFLMNEYELILLEIKSFIQSYKAFVDNTNDSGQEVCSKFASETSNIFNKINAQLRIVEKNFNTVFVENQIPAPTKRNLFGFN